MPRGHLLHPAQGVHPPVTTTAQALTVPCPACQSEVGNLCTTPTDTGRRVVTWVHYDREDAYELTQYKEEDPFS